MAECCFDTGGIGVAVNLAAVADVPDAFRVNATLFGESASRVVVSSDDERIEALLAKAAASGLPATEIGRTGGDRIRLAVDGHVSIDVSAAAAEQAWATVIEKKMSAR